MTNFRSQGLTIRLPFGQRKVKKETLHVRSENRFVKDVKNVSYEKPQRCAEGSRYGLGLGLGLAFRVQVRVSGSEFRFGLRVKG